MDNIQVFLALILIRLIIPSGLLILIGEWNRHSEAQYRLRNEQSTNVILQRSLQL